MSTQSNARSTLRSKLLGTAHKPRSMMVTLFGEQLEIRQPSLETILEARETDSKLAAVDMLIKYCFVPGTDERVFERADRDTILQWPFGEDFVNLQQAIAELTAIHIDVAAQEVEKSPLENS